MSKDPWGFGYVESGLIRNPARKDPDCTESVCEVCGGSGFRERRRGDLGEAWKETCPDCRGTGKIVTRTEENYIEGVKLTATEPCPTCHSNSHEGCPECGGRRNKS